MTNVFTLKSRGKEMVCVLSYRDEAVRGKNVILYKHGFLGNKISPHRMIVNLAEQLLPRGYSFFRFDCAGAGDSEGDCSYTTITGELTDTLVVLDYIRNNLKAERLILLGYSLGGFIVPLVYEKSNPDGLILWSPAADIIPIFETFLGKELYLSGKQGSDVDFAGDRIGKEFFMDLDKQSYDPLVSIKGFTKPVRIIQGDEDTVVPMSASQLFTKAAPDVKYHVIRGANHGYDCVKHQDELFAMTDGYIKEIWGF